jgi:hypothetical protein
VKDETALYSLRLVLQKKNCFPIKASVSVALDLKYFKAIITDISNSHTDMRRNKTSAY